MNKEILKMILEGTGFTQREFSEQIKCTETQLSKWLSGSRNIREKRLKEILTQFNLKISFELLAQ